MYAVATDLEEAVSGIDLDHPRQLAIDETVGPDSASFHGGFTGWSVLETIVLNRYRVTAG
jgi:hypothetical protein